MKLTTFDRTFIPDVKFPAGPGKFVSNRAAKEGQVICTLSLATIEQKSKYLGSYTLANKQTIKKKEVHQITDYKFDECIIKHVEKITGLEEDGITNGKTLIKNQTKFVETLDIIQECFHKITGIHEDDDKGEETSDAGEFSEGESKASE